MKKNVWILGGTGFIGKAIVKCLSSSKDYQLHLLVHKNIPFKFLESYSLFTGNLEDFDLSWMEKYPPDIIFHMARLAGSNAITRRLSSYKGAKANERLIQYLSERSLSPIIVYVSGSLMYGNQKLGQFADENSTLNPVSYARYYSGAEEPWVQAQHKGKLDIRFARPGWILGPDSWFRIFYWQPYLRTGKIPLYGDGSQLMSLIQLDDCADQIINLAEKGAVNQNLNVFAGPPISQKDFALLIANHLNTEIDEISISKLKKVYGNTISEALTSSIPMVTKFPAIAKGNADRYPNVEAMLEYVFSFFEDKKTVFTKSPQKSFVEKQIDSPKILS